MDFYIEEIFTFQYNQYGLLRLHSDETFRRLVSVTQKKDQIDWMTLSEKEEEQVKTYYEKFNNRKI